MGCTDLQDYLTPRQTGVPGVNHLIIAKRQSRLVILFKSGWNPQWLEVKLSRISTINKALQNFTAKLQYEFTHENNTGAVVIFLNDHLWVCLPDDLRIDILPYISMTLQNNIIYTRTGVNRRFRDFTI